MLRAAAALLIGLLLGSILPADIFARRRGIDIRAVGDGNPGTVNTWNEIGPAAGLVTVLYDASVGVITIQIAMIIGASGAAAYLAGIAAVVGHCFPVFRGFRGGGQGMAASAGMMVYGVALAVASGWLTTGDLLLVVAVGVATFLLTHSATMVAIVMLPVLAAKVIAAPTEWHFAVFMTAVIAHIWLVQVAAQRGHPFRNVRAVRGRAGR